MANKSTPSNEILPHWLFGVHIYEIALFFKRRFAYIKTNANQNNTVPLQVTYGTPRAAFRWNINKFNGKVVLPMLNFFLTDYTKDAIKNRPVVLYTKETIDEKRGTISGMRAPTHFNLNFSFNLYTSSNRERDAIMQELFQCMPMGDMWLHYYPDPDNYPDVVMAIPVEMDEGITDDTEIEGLDQSETRDMVRTTFQMQAKGMVPMKFFEVPVVRKIQAICETAVSKSKSVETLSLELTSKLIDSEITQD